MEAVIGWDVGGAHLKAARAENGVITEAAQIACPLWLGTGELDRAFSEARECLGRAPLNAVTMTGELSDIFATRAQGVTSLAGRMTELLQPDRAMFYSCRCGLVPPGEAAGRAAEIASANFHASAAFIAKHLPAALFIDIGSTTADIIPVACGRPANLGRTDAERLVHGELVYTGLVRSFLMSGPKLVPFAGGWTPLMNEWFAAMADVHRILGQLPGGADLMDTPDGREKTVAGSIARLARMIGRDSSEADKAAWEGLAQFFAEAQLRGLTDAAFLVLSRGVVPRSAPAVGAGIGRGIARELAARLHRTYIDFEELIDAAPHARAHASDCAAAASLALLAQAHFA